MPTILMHPPDLPLQNIANYCFLTELTGVNSSRNDSTLGSINDQGHIDYSAFGNINPDTNFLMGYVPVFQFYLSLKHGFATIMYQRIIL